MALSGSKQARRSPRRAILMSQIGLIKDAALLIKEDKITALGSYPNLKKLIGGAKVKVLDAKGKVVLPGFVDCHTHAVFAAPRLKDFELRVKGWSYEQIAEKGGGIKRSLRDLRESTPEALKGMLERWCEVALRHGTTIMEVKSGYGLNYDSELKILRVIRDAQTPLELVATFMGAHALPQEHEGNRQGYIREITERMLPRFKGMAKFCDVFCDQGFFSPDESRRILEKAKRLGYGLKIHAEQLHRTGAARLGCDLSAVSVDHLDQVEDKDIRVLAKSPTLAVLLPGANLFLSTKRYPPARKMIEGGAAVALASDFNPGTSPTLNMGFILSLAVTQMRMSPEEALTAGTINGAWALGIAARVGSLETGKQADLILADVADYREIPYYFAVNMVGGVIKKGSVLFWN